MLRRGINTRRTCLYQVLILANVVICNLMGPVLERGAG